MQEIHAALYLLFFELQRVQQISQGDKLGHDALKREMKLCLRGNHCDLNNDLGIRGTEFKCNYCCGG